MCKRERERKREYELCKKEVSDWTWKLIPKIDVRKRGRERKTKGKVEMIKM